VYSIELAEEEPTEEEPTEEEPTEESAEESAKTPPVDLNAYDATPVESDLKKND
jgi:hypothetical protein